MPSYLHHQDRYWCPDTNKVPGHQQHCLNCNHDTLIIFCNASMTLQLINHRADSRFAPSQWEMALLGNKVSHNHVEDRKGGFFVFMLQKNFLLLSDKVGCVACHWTNKWVPIRNYINHFTVRSQGFEAIRFGHKMITSLWNLTGAWATLLPRHISYFRVIGQLWVQFSEFRGYMTSNNKRSHQTLKQTPGSRHINIRQYMEALLSLPFPVISSQS